MKRTAIFNVHVDCSCRATHHIFILVSVIVRIAGHWVAIFDDELHGAGHCGGHLGGVIIRDGQTCVRDTCTTLVTSWQGPHNTGQLTRLVVHEEGAGHVGHHLEPVARLDLHRHLLQHLVVEGVRAIELKNAPMSGGSPDTRSTHLQHDVLRERVFDAADHVLCLALGQLGRVRRLKEGAEDGELGDAR